MHRCLVTTDALLADAVALEREEARHLQTVLRVRPGDRVALFDGRGRTRTAVVSDAQKHRLALAPEGPAVEHPRPRCALTLFACVSKGNRMDWTVEKAVELGVATVAPVLSERTVVRLDAEERPAKAERWDMGARIREHRASVILALDTLDIEAQMSCTAIFLNALFSMSELAIVSARTARLKVAADEGSTRHHGRDSRDARSGR